MYKFIYYLSIFKINLLFLENELNKYGLFYKNYIKMYEDVKELYLVL